MQKPTESNSNASKSGKSNFISQDKFTLKNENGLSTTPNQYTALNQGPAKRGRKKLTSNDPFEDLNYNWEKTDYNDDHFESFSSSSSKKKSDSGYSEDETQFYGDSYTETDDENNYESFGRG